MDLHKNYITYQSYECLNACLVNCLRFSNCCISGSDIFFIGDGSGFVFKKNEEENRRVVATRQYEANYEFCKRVGIEYSVDSVRGEDDVAALEQMIEQKACIPIHASSLFLTYNPVFLKREAFHFLNVLSVDRSNGRLYISDGYIPTAKAGLYEGWVSMADIMTGWKRADNRVFAINSMPKEELLISELNNVYDYMVQSVKKYINGDEKNLADNKKIITYVDSVLNNFDNLDQYLKEISDLNFNFKVNGFFSYKYYILEQLQRAQKEICPEYENLIKKWEAWFMNMTKLRVTYRAEKNKSSYEKFLYLTESEEKTLRKLL